MSYQEAYVLLEKRLAEQEKNLVQLSKDLRAMKKWVDVVERANPTSRGFFMLFLNRDTLEPRVVIGGSQAAATVKAEQEGLMTKPWRFVWSDWE